jgi:uncharacterized protein (TIGR03790 family)
VVVVRSLLLSMSLLATAPLAWAELLPDQVVIVANINSRDSLKVAEHYAARRGVPPNQIIKLDLPPDETIGRHGYDRLMVLPLRQALHTQNLYKRVRVVVTVYGVPLRVGPPLYTAEEQALRRDVATKLEAARSRLAEVDRQARLIGSPRPAPEPKPESDQDQGLQTHERNLAFFFRVNQAVDHALQQARQQQPMDHQGYARLESMVHTYQGLAGVAALHHTLPKPDSVQSRGEEDLRGQQLEGLQLLVASLELPVRRQRAEFYRRIELAYGQYGVFALAAMELDALSDESGDASVDSELSLLWWDRGDYSVAWRHPNSFYHAFISSKKTALQDLPVLMVSRLDAPTAELAMQLVDRAMEAEKQGLTGTVYLDAQGMPLKDSPDTYTKYDQSLQNLHAFIGEHSSYRSILENTKARFERPGQAPDVAFYVGWYRLRHYEDAFVFRPGAIGYHMASAEAVSLHQPGETGWCKNALERGITATLGSVGEPYLDAFPEPLEFAALLMTGQYSLVEAYYVTSRWVSWRMVLVGDPLYNPLKNNPAIKRSALSMFSLAPIAPSDRTVIDPIRAKEERRRGYERSWVRLDEILRQQEQATRQAAP